MAKPYKIIVVSREFDELLNRQLEQLISDCETLGIRGTRIPKTKATKLLAKRIIENEAKINLKLIQ